MDAIPKDREYLYSNLAAPIERSIGPRVNQTSTLVASIVHNMGASRKQGTLFTIQHTRHR